MKKLTDVCGYKNINESMNSEQVTKKITGVLTNAKNILKDLSDIKVDSDSTVRVGNINDAIELAERLTETIKDLELQTKEVVEE